MVDIERVLQVLVVDEVHESRPEHRWSMDRALRRLTALHPTLSMLPG